jgi:hypothetical protein
MTVVNALSRPKPSHVFFNGKLVDRSRCVQADDVAGYIDMLVPSEKHGWPHVQIDPLTRKPATIRKHGVVRFVFAVKLDSQGR